MTKSERVESPLSLIIVIIMIMIIIIIISALPFVSQASNNKYYSQTMANDKLDNREAGRIIDKNESVRGSGSSSAHLPWAILQKIYIYLFIYSTFFVNA